MKWVFYFLGFYILIRLIDYVMRVRALLLARSQRVGTELKERSEMPGVLERLYGQGEAVLLDFGFEYSHCQVANSCFVTSGPNWKLLYRHPEHFCYASLSLKNGEDDLGSIRIDFLTFFADETILQTTDCMAHTIFGVERRCILEDHYVGDIEEQFGLHVRRSRELEGVHGEGVFWESEQFFEWDRQENEALSDRLVEGGVLAEASEGYYRFKLWPAMKLAQKIIKGNQRAKKVKKFVKGSVDATWASEDEVEAYKQAFAKDKGVKRGLGKKWFFLLVSVGIFWLSFRRGWGFSGGKLLMLIGAVFFHELGHLLGMALFGYKDLQVLFLPFLGAITMGKKRDVPAYQKYVMYMLGPIPGLVLGLAIFLRVFDDNESWYYGVGFMLVILNYLNLLPVMPMDGGQVVNLLIFSRFPQLEFVFHLMGVLAFASLAFLGHPLVILILAAFLALQLRVVWLKSRVLRRLKEGWRNLGEDNDDELLGKIVTVLREGRYAKVPFSIRSEIAGSAMENVRKRGLGVISTTVMLILYLMVLFGTPGVFLWIGYLIHSGLEGRLF